MREKFEVGEIAILVQDRTITNDDNLRYDGEECEILETLAAHAVHPNDQYPFDTLYGYTVLLRDGKVLVCAPHELKKKKQPGDDAVWAEKKTKDLLATLVNKPEPVAV